jgi:hypothetical protein
MFASLLDDNNLCEVVNEWILRQIKQNVVYARLKEAFKSQGSLTALEIFSIINSLLTT